MLFDILFRKKRPSARAQIATNGERNTIALDDAVLGEKSSIVINGNDNTFEFCSGTANALIGNINGNGNTIKIGKHCNINKLHINITGNGYHILLGDYIAVDDSLTIFSVDGSSTVHIGSGCTFVETVISLAEGSSCRIGQDCMFSSAVQLLCSDYHSIVSSVTGEKLNRAQGITVGNHVWVGMRAMLLKNIAIEDNSVIAAGAVVAKNVPGNCCVGGNPARVIRKDIDWSRERP
jgi:acetyltransferase-like isoleucine patch superfamily enzyme